MSGVVKAQVDHIHVGIITNSILIGVLYCNMSIPRRKKKSRLRVTRKFAWTAHTLRTAIIIFSHCHSRHSQWIFSKTISEERNSRTTPNLRLCRETNDRHCSLVS
eukprot:scaffold1225_cov164-Amphora_coffeaeformis.AAC.12